MEETGNTGNGRIRKSVADRITKLRRKTSSRLPALLSGIGAVFFILILIAFVRGGIFEWNTEPPKLPAPEEKDPDVPVVKKLYDELFQMMAHRNYENALPKAEQASKMLTVLVERYPQVPWIDDYFRRVAQWERELRDWEFEKEMQEMRNKSPSP